jgi:hypothetical protein
MQTVLERLAEAFSLYLLLGLIFAAASVWAVAKAMAAKPLAVRSVESGLGGNPKE